MTTDDFGQQRRAGYSDAGASTRRTASAGRSRAAHRLEEDSSDSTERYGQYESTAWTRAGGSEATRYGEESRYDQSGGYDDPADDDGGDLGPPLSRLDEDERDPLAWHGGADFGLLVLRLLLGGLFILRGAQKVFDVLGGAGIDGFAEYLQEIGFTQPTILAWGIGITELLGGLLLVIGLATPFAASALLCVMANAILVNRADGFFLPDGVEYEVAVAGMAFVALFAGPGRAAFDRGRAWFRRPLISGFVCLVLAAGVTAVAQFVLR